MDAVWMTKQKSNQNVWASELIARNLKVARNICWSADSDGGDCGGGGDVFILSSSGGGEDEEGRRQTMVKRGMTTNTKMASREQGKVVDPIVVIPSSSAYIRTEKSAPIRDEAAEDEEEMKEKNAEESILEYGPGIVRKLRSRYQSLALRQSVRPTLRRSTSLENCLDSVSSEQLSSDSPSPVPYHYEDDVDNNSRRIGGGGGVGDREKNSNIVQNNNHHNGSQHHGVVMNRGRAAYSEYNTRKDRMKRARSVDALHRPLHRCHEDEKKDILEKFRTVVLPKEEIVIIEVSKPRANISYGGSSSESNYFIDDKLNSQQQQHLYMNNNHGYSGNSSEPNRVRSVTSPEHELPPADIVRETARIFEKNHDNNNQTTANNNLLISSIKKVGHALRLSKSSSVSPSSSPLPSPTTTTTTSYTTMMNGQVDGNGSYQNKNHLMAQGSNTLTAHQQKFNKQQQESFQRDKNFIVNGCSSPTSNFSPHKSSPNNNFVANQHSNISPNKQIGVIRPTVTTVTSGSVLSTAPINGVISSSASSKGNAENPAPKISPIDVSPIHCSSSASTPLNKFLHNHSNKPPLSPKPLFTSSPKNIFLVNHNSKTGGGGGKMTESSNNSNGNAKSPEEPYDSNLSFDNSSSSHLRGGKSSSTATSTTTPSPVQTHGLIPNGNSNSNFKNIPMSTEKSPPPPDKENKEQKEIMEFQKISLKPVAKLSDHSEIILSNGTTNNNSTNNKMTISNNNKTNNNESKTERKDQKSNAKQPQQSLPKSVAPASTVPIVSSSKTSSPSEKPVEKPIKGPSVEQQQSQLRAHQKQKLAQQANNGNGSMVFNFTNRQKVPDYIEDDGLHAPRITLGGTVTDESQDDDGDGQGWSEDDHVDARLIQFEGANVIINGRSSLQKKPKSQKMNISFNEDATTTFEYPSEASVLGDDDNTDSGKDTLLGHKSPNILNSSGGGLGSYTPSKTGKTYQLGGNLSNRNSETTSSKKSPESKKEDNTTVEDLLPDEGSTTWSNEIIADILF